MTPRRRGRGKSIGDRQGQLLEAMAALLAAVPLTPALLTRIIRDPGMCTGGNSYSNVQAEIGDIWSAPHAHLHVAGRIAEVLARLDAPWELVLPVYVTEYDYDFPQNVPGWAGWQRNTGAHEAIRSIFEHFGGVFDREEGERDRALLELLRALGGDSGGPWDGSAPRSVAEFAERPGDFAPGVALVFVDEMRNALYEEEYEPQPYQSGVEEQLDLIEAAARLSRGEMQDECGDPKESAQLAILPNAPVGPILEDVWPTLTNQDRTILTALMTVIDRGETPTARRLGRELGGNVSEEAIRQARRRVKTKLSAYLPLA